MFICIYNVFVYAHDYLYSIFICLHTYIYLHTFVPSNWLCRGLVRFCKKIHPPHESRWGKLVAVGFVGSGNARFANLQDIPICSVIFSKKPGKSVEKWSRSQLKTRWAQNPVINGVKKINSHNWVVVSNSCFFTPSWGRFSIWLIFFERVETTNYR